MRDATSPSPSTPSEPLSPSSSSPFRFATHKVTIPRHPLLSCLCGRVSNGRYLLSFAELGPNGRMVALLQEIKGILEDDLTEDSETSSSFSYSSSSCAPRLYVTEPVELETEEVWVTALATNRHVRSGVVWMPHGVALHCSNSLVLIELPSGRCLSASPRALDAWCPTYMKGYLLLLSKRAPALQLLVYDR
jgi:hypothetical protein